MVIHYSDVDGVPMLRMPVREYDEKILGLMGRVSDVVDSRDRALDEGDEARRAATTHRMMFKEAMADVDAWHALAREHGAEGQRPEDLRDTLAARISENHHRSEAMYNEAIAALAKWRKLAIEHGARGATGDVMLGHLRTILVGERERKERDRYIRDRLGVLRRERDKASNLSAVALQDWHDEKAANVDKTADLDAWARLARSYDVEGDDAETLREGLRSRIGDIRSNLAEVSERFVALRLERDEVRANQRDAEKSDSDMISRAVVQAKTLDVWQSLARGYGLQGEGADLVDSLREFVDFLRSGQTVKLADVLELVRGERVAKDDVEADGPHAALDRQIAAIQDWREMANMLGCDYGSNENMIANLKTIIHADRGNLSKYIEEVTDWRKLAYSYGCDGDPSTRENLRKYIDGLRHRDQCAELREVSWRDLAKSYGCAGGNDAADQENLSGYIEGLVKRVKELLGKLRAQRKVPTVPRQPVVIDEEGIARYRANDAVSWLLAQIPQGLRVVWSQGFSDADNTQLAQLIGYSVSAAGGLSYFDPAVTSWADAEVERLTEQGEP